MTERFGCQALRCCAFACILVWGMAADRVATAAPLKCQDLIAFANSATAPVALKSTAFCGESLRPGGATARHCAWAYPYRAPEAVSAAGALGQSIESCLGAVANHAPDTRVNHPDSYDLRRWRLEQRTITLSVKDKAARGETFVFLSITSPAAAD